jgi:hypothetical protein
MRKFVMLMAALVSGIALAQSPTQMPLRQGIPQLVQQPQSDTQILFLDSTDGLLKLKSYTGALTTIGSGAAGGSNGQPQYNLNGAFAGFTFGGDCTFAVPNLTCTKTGGVSFATSATVDTTNANNITAGTLAAARGGAGTVNGLMKANGSGVVAAVTIGSGLSYDGTTLSSTGSGGTVTTVSSGNLSGLFTVGVDTPTSTPAFTFTPASVTANFILAGPCGGGPAAWTLRAVCASDIPVLPDTQISSSSVPGQSYVSGALTDLQTYAARINVANTWTASQQINAALGLGVAPATGAALEIGGSRSSAAWTTNGLLIRQDAATLTDTSSSGTVASMYTNVFGNQTLVASSSTTYTTHAANYFKNDTASTNVSIGSNFAAIFDGATNFTNGSVSITGARLTFQTSASATQWGNVGRQINGTAATYTDSSTAGSGTAALEAINSFVASTLASTNSSVTTTDAAEVYISGAVIKGSNNTATASYGLLIDTTNVGAQTASYGLRVKAQTGATTNWSAWLDGAVKLGGHVVTSGTAPSLSSCGSSPSISGTDMAGTVTAGGTATACTVTFASAWSAAPHCNVTPQTGSVTNTFSYSISTTAITVTETGLGGGLFDYNCTQ